MRLTEFKTALQSKIEVFHKDLSEARKAEKELIADVHAKGGVIPNNHWQPRHRAEAQLYAAYMLMELLDEITESRSGTNVQK